MVKLIEVDKVFPEKCKNRLEKGTRDRCAINFYPTEFHALNDLNPYTRKDARENRFGYCEPGSPSCKPSYNEEFLRMINWIRRAKKDMN